jgi:hypothetical protein
MPQQGDIVRYEGPAYLSLDKDEIVWEFSLPIRGQFMVEDARADLLLLVDVMDDEQYAVKREDYSDG